MKPYKGRDIQGYLESLDSEKRLIVEELREVIRETMPDAKEMIKWGTLTYNKDRVIGAVMAHKNTVNLQLWRGSELNDRDRLLQGTGRGMRHIPFTDKSEIKKTKLKALLRQASKLH